VKRTWQVDDATVVEASFGALGQESVSVNGVEVHNRRNLLGKCEIVFDLGDGRPAVVSADRLALARVPELRVNGRMLIETGKDPVHCPACGITVKPNDRFCDGCGHALPSGEHRMHQRHVREATSVIKMLALLFSVMAPIMFLITKSKASAALSSLEGMNPEAAYPIPVDGVTYTVRALREQLLWEQWGVLIINLILAAVMTGLAIWGKRAPLPAVLVATATYAVVNVANAIVDPGTLGQGLLLKIIIIIFLAKGIKAALALRSTHA
jgi:predicted nucleic acid-binding Zn ribbon protein